MNKAVLAFMALAMAFMAVSCQSDEELSQEELPQEPTNGSVATTGTVSVSINGIINGYTPQDATRAVAQNVVRILWQGEETVYVYEGATYLGSLAAAKGDDAGTYAKLSGTIGTPTSGKTLTLVYSPQFSEKPTVTTDGKLSLDLSIQSGDEVPFLIYATMPATEVTEINGASVHFDLATSVYKCNCTGLVAEGDITKAVIGEVNTVCELTLSDKDAPTIGRNTTLGNITRTAGFKVADKRSIFSIAVARTIEANARTIEITKGGRTFGAAFDNGALNPAAAYNTVIELKEKETPEVLGFGTGTAKRDVDTDGNQIKVKWVQLWSGGPKFAEYNVGAMSVTEYGGYYCWGSSINKDSNIYYNDGAAVLTGTDDTATNLWGNNWRMPTSAELQALLDKCDVKWTDTYNSIGIKGLIFTGRGAYSSNSVFLPAAGSCNYGDVGGQGYGGGYWSSTPSGGYNADDLNFASGNQYVGSNGRYYGFSVRAVLKETPATKGIAKATIGGSEVDVNWVQLWSGGPKFADRNVEGTMTFEEATATNFIWGTNWCTPSQDDMDELRRAVSGNARDGKVKCEYTEEGGKYGFKFTGREEGYTENSVFFPTQDGGDETSGDAYYWSSTTNTRSEDADAYVMYMNYISGGGWAIHWEEYSLCGYNFLVRPVLAEN